MSITSRPKMKSMVKYAGSYDLPDELEEGDSITVVSFSTGYCDVQDEHGRVFQLFMGRVDCGMLYEINHRWLRPNHPQVIQEHQRYESLKSNRQRKLAHREEDWGRRPEPNHTDGKMIR